MIERITEATMPDFINLAKTMHAESRQARMPFREEKVRALLKSDSIFLALWRSEAGIRGFMAGVVYPDLWTDAKVACDIALYVSGPNRGIAAKRLVEAFEAWAKERGAVEIRIGVMAGIDDEGADGFYTGLGYRYDGRLKVKEI